MQVMCWLIFMKEKETWATLVFIHFQNNYVCITCNYSWPKAFKNGEVSKQRLAMQHPLVNVLWDALTVLSSPFSAVLADHAHSVRTNMLLNYTSSEVLCLLVKYYNNCSEDRIISPQTLSDLPLSIKRNTVINFLLKNSIFIILLLTVPRTSTSQF